jgi:hypothetical protein
VEAILINVGAIWLAFDISHKDLKT